MMESVINMALGMSISAPVSVSMPKTMPSKGMVKYDINTPPNRNIRNGLLPTESTLTSLSINPFIITVYS